MNMPFFCCFVAMLLSYSALHSQCKSESQMPYEGITYDVFNLTVDSTLSRKLTIVTNTSGAKHLDFVNQLPNGNKMMLINGGSTEQNCIPTGLLISNSIEHSKINLADGSGNFFLKPNGLLLIRKNEVVITESSSAGSLNNVVTGIQSGPMLLVNGNVHPQFNNNSTNRNIRSGVGVYKKGGFSYLVFATSNQPVTFYDFAMFFKSYFGCNNALCLESAGCAMHLPFIDKILNTNQVICNYLMCEP